MSFSSRRLITVVLATASILLTITTQGDDPKPSSVPDAANTAAAEKSLKEIFRKEYADKTPAARLDFAKKLLHQAIETSDIAPKFVMLRDAREMAASAGDLPTLQDAIAATSSAFEVDVSEITFAGLSAISLTSKNTPNVTRAFIELSENAATAGAYDISIKAAVKSGTLATAAKDAILVKAAQTQLADAREGQLDLQRSVEAIKKLATDPADPNANLIAGKFLCFRRGEWEQGLPLLAKSADADLQSVASKDIAAPTTAPDQIKLADTWWVIGDKQVIRNRSPFHRRAIHWYALAANEIHGLEQANYQARLQSFAASETKVTYLADLPETAAHVLRAFGWTFDKKGLLGNPGKSAISVGGVRSANGIGTHPGNSGTSADVVYNLANRYVTFDGAVALNDGSGGTDPLTFKIFADGKEVWHSEPIKTKVKDNFCLYIKGVKELKIVVECPGDFNGADAVWFEPRLGR